jgi:hypothetical protein
MIIGGVRKIGQVSPAPFGGHMREEVANGAMHHASSRCSNNRIPVR